VSDATHDHGLLSLLYLEGLLKDHSGQAFYCPSEQDVYATFDSPKNPWTLRPSNPPHPHLVTGAGPETATHTRIGYNTRPCADWFNGGTSLNNKAVNGLLYAKPFLVFENKFGFPTFAKLKSKAILCDSNYYKLAVATRHKQGINVLYADGSGKWVPLSVFDKAPWNQIPPDFDNLPLKAENWKYLDETGKTYAHPGNKPSGVWLDLDNAK
jgi:prepilin-type processing-associated H-X9-DG protein